MRSAALAGVRFLARLLVVDAPRVLGGVDKSLLSQIAQGASHQFHLLSRGSVAHGIRESAQSWKELLLDLKRRGLTIDPQLAIADGALGFWKAIEEVWPKTRAQRCWVHKTANVLNRLPKSLQAKAKRALQDIWMAETRKAAEAALDAFIETYGIKYEKAVECLTKDREALLAFYDFPAEHWKHLRTTNPIESTFATVRHRTVR